MTTDAPTVAAPDAAGPDAAAADAPAVLTTPAPAVDAAAIAAALAAIDAAVAGERLTAARAALAAHDLAGWPGPARARHALRAAELDLARGELDEAILAARALAPADLPVEEDARRCALIATAYGRKRCAALAAAALADAATAHPTAWRVSLAAGEIALGQDDRDAAAAHFTQAIGRGGGAIAATAAARVAFVVGDFARAEAILIEAETLATAPEHRAAIARLRAALASADGDHAAEAVAWADVRAAVPDGDRAAVTGLNHGFALAAAGQRAAACAVLEEVWHAHPDDPSGAYARSRAELLARAPADAVRRALPFPTTQQKYEFCGPAVLELCLRSLGIELGQDEIARAVKRDRGTPMFEIVQFLGAHAIVARRVVATVDKVRAAIDLGLPMIIQEEYATTSHVAVIMGYDAALEVFLVRDPMTHQLSTRPWGWTESAGWLYGSGAVLVIGRSEDGGTAERVAGADAAGLVDAPHLRLCDDISRRRGGRGEAGEITPIEILELTSRALEHEAGFGLAWMHRFWAYAALASTDRDRWSDPALDCLLAIREAFPYDEWPWQAHGRWLLNRGAFAEAFAAYVAAHRADPDDGNNLAWMGYCRQRERRLDEAERHLRAALAAEGDLGLREGILAETYLMALEAQDGAGPDAAARAGVPTITPRSDVTVEGHGVHPRAELLRRGRHFAEVATELLPAQRYYRDLAGLLALRADDLAAARGAFVRATDGQPERFLSRLGLAEVELAEGAAAAALGHLADVCRFAAADPDPWLRRAALLAQGGDGAGAAAVLEEALTKVTSGRDRLVEPLYARLSERGSAEEAAGRLRELVSAHGDDADLLLAAAGQLDNDGQRGHAVALLRAALELTPAGGSTAGADGSWRLTAMVRLGRILVDSSLTRDEGRRLLAAAVDEAPDWTFARRTLAMAWADDDPGRGLELLGPALDDDDLYVNEVHALLLEAAGRTADAERITRRVISAHDGPPVEALTRMCSWNWSGNRYERALSWARRLRTTPLAADDDPDDVVDTWLTAYRLAGRVDEVLPELQARYRDLVPAVVARELYLAVSHHDRALAARAAEVVAAGATTDGDRLEWRIEAAKMRGQGGETDAVAALWDDAARLGSAEGWANLAWGFARLKQWDDANRAADAAIAVDDRDLYAITAALEAAMRRGDLGHALALAERVHALYPYDHRGPERLAELHAKALQAEQAVAFAERAIEAAPYCHHAQGYGAMAFLVAGDIDRARRHAEQALRLTPPDDPDAYDAGLLVLRAATGDLAGLERCIASSSEPAAPLAPFFDRLRAIARR